MVDGVKIRVFDTPGLKSSAFEQSYNRKVLSNVKKLTKKCPPDIVLYVDRLDLQTRDMNDLPMLRSVTSALGPSIWRNVIVTLTHAASAPPDG
ncbi:translocase of chloroplast 159 chloroplastic-like, partial [Trifolium medium]|nr:translocase of chloroplast 159 chloroplastic-like [Trifolium medium]